MTQTIDQRARELLAKHYELSGTRHYADELRNGYQGQPQAIAALTEALTRIEELEGVNCPAEYAHPFFVYDFMPQKIMFKSDRGDDSMALDVLRVRGWGHLTGHGEAGLRINHEDAAAIQDNFGKWVAKTLTEALTKGIKE